MRSGESLWLSGSGVGGFAGMAASAAAAPGIRPLLDAMINAARVCWYNSLKAFLIGGGFRTP